MTKPDRCLRTLEGGMPDGGGGTEGTRTDERCGGQSAKDSFHGNKSGIRGQPVECDK